MHCDPVLSKLLDGLSFQDIDNSDDIIFALNADLEITYVNQGWLRFAERNGGDTVAERWSVGRRFMDAIPFALQPFYREHFAKVLAENRPWEHQYEYSSPALYRQFHMLSYPLGDAERILVVNSLVQEDPHQEKLCEPNEGVYRNQDGLIIQCCHCRRVRRNGLKQQWDMVPSWVAVIPPNTSHGLCYPCNSYYYASSINTDRGFPETFHTYELQNGDRSFIDETR